MCKVNRSQKFFLQMLTLYQAPVWPRPWQAFLLEILAPSKNLWPKKAMMHNLGKNIFPSFRCAFVLPTYEIHESAALPQDKSQLAELVKRFVEVENWDFEGW